MAHTNTTREQWSYILKQQFSSGYAINTSDPYVDVMMLFHMFTNQIVAALALDNDQSRSLVEDGKLDKIYSNLPAFDNNNVHCKFRDWVQDATLKHPQRRTREQQLWLCIVDLLASASIFDDVTLIVDSALESINTWEERVFDIENLVVDWDAVGAHHFFSTKHAIKDADRGGNEQGEACLICANDFDTDAHRPQHGPCGHYQCRHCFQNAIEYAASQYTCAFCRACLICGVSSCKSHVITREAIPPYPLDAARYSHMLCIKGRCILAEPLLGLSPKQYWTLREETRSIRTRLADTLKHIDRNVHPELEAYLSKSRNEIIESFRAIANRVRSQQ